MTDAIRPANSAVQSKNIWNESDIRPRLKESMWYWSYLLVLFSELNGTTRVIVRNRVTCWSIFHTPIPQTQKTNWGEGKRINSLNFHWQISLCEKTDEKMLWHHWTHGQKRSRKPFKIEVIWELYLSHSSIRDLSFSPGLKSSLFKLSLLVNGSMPTLFLWRPQTHSRPSSAISYVAFKAELISCAPEMLRGAVAWLSLCYSAVVSTREKNLFFGCFAVGWESFCPSL